MTFNKSETYGLIGTVLLHGLILLCLLFFGFTKSEPIPKENEGLTVNFGNVDEAAGLFEPAGEAINTESEAIPEPTPETKPEKALITQSSEPSISLDDKKEKQKDQAIQKEKQLQKEQNQKVATIRNQAANAFGTSTGKGKSQGTASTGTGNQGNPKGDPQSKNTAGGGTGYGNFSLNGRSLNGDLPHPSFSIQEEGVVVVQITVHPKGNVIASSISLKGTNTDNSILRNAALRAAKQARFNTIDGSQSQSGTITYRFRLR